MFTVTLNNTNKLLIKYSLMIAVALGIVFFALVTPVSAADDPATPMNVTTTVNAPYVTIAWTSTVESQYTLFRSATGAWSDAVATNAAMASSVSVDSPDISYSFVDTAPTSGITYTYWIVNNDSMKRSPYGPYSATISQKIFFAFVGR
jgi:hypothetical protein